MRVVVVGMIVLSTACNMTAPSKVEKNPIDVPFTVLREELESKPVLPSQPLRAIEDNVMWGF